MRARQDCFISISSRAGGDTAVHDVGSQGDRRKAFCGLFCLGLLNVVPRTRGSGVRSLRKSGGEWSMGVKEFGGGKRVSGLSSVANNPHPFSGSKSQQGVPLQPKGSWGCAFGV